MTKPIINPIKVSFTINIQGCTFEYFIDRKPIRSLRLKILSDKSFSISCPKYTPDFVIKKFITDNILWIYKHSQKIPKTKSILNLNKISILDRSYDLVWIKTQRDSVLIFETEQKIYANVSKNTEEHAKKILENKLKILALTLIKGELKRLSNMFGFKYNRVSVKNQSSRFGSCSSRGNLNFNWQIIFFPTNKFRHILLHELTHLKIKNHSKAFWDQLAFYDPKSKDNNKWLKNEGTKLFIIKT